MHAAPVNTTTERSAATQDFFLTAVVSAIVNTQVEANVTIGFPCEEVLTHCPFPVAALDEQQVIRWVNPAFATLVGTDSSGLIGESLMSLSILDGFFQGETLISFNSPASGNVILQRSSSQMCMPDNENWSLFYFQIIQADTALQQENLRLRQQVEKLTLTDSLTGLANERAMSQQLSIQVSRSRRYGNPLTLVLLNMELSGPDMSFIADDAFNQAIISTSQFLRERLRWADFIARCNAGRFVILLPETTAEEADSLFSKIVADMRFIDLDEASKKLLTLHYGLAQWQSGNDPKMLVANALASLSRSDLPSPAYECHN